MTIDSNAEGEFTWLVARDGDVDQTALVGDGSLATLVIDYRFLRFHRCEDTQLDTADRLTVSHDLCDEHHVGWVVAVVNRGKR